MSAHRLRIGVGLCALAVASGALAHVRLRHPSNQNPLFWSDPTSISVVIQATGSDDLPDGSHRTALRNAIAAWNGATGTSARLVENASPAQQARTDWQSFDLHLLLFDEVNSSGYFPMGSGTVAITPVWFYSSGVIADADVIFNGRSFLFTTSGQLGRFDVQDVAAHELGHLLGLDHSGWAGATMYPYVSSGMILHRSLSDDDVHGLRDAYPQGNHGTLRGRLRRISNHTDVAGAHVVARDTQGRTRAAGLTATNGTFALRGLDAGTYELYAQPLEHPVNAANLGSGWTIQTDFGPTLLGSHGIVSGQDLDLGNLGVQGPRSISLGRNTDVLPLRGIADGATRTYLLRGAGLVDGSTLAASDPALTVAPLAWLGTQVQFQLSVPLGAPSGHVDLVATEPGGDFAILAAAVEITPPDPSVSLVSPNQVLLHGGTDVTIVGTNFQPGARVVIGDRIYVDGQGATVSGPNTIELTTVATAPGTYDVVVIDPSGVEGRAVGALQFLSAPDIAVIFPVAGTSAGGTEIVLTGSGFLAGLSVRIDGVLQTDVELVNASRVVVRSEGGLPGGPYVLEIANLDGSSAQAAFAYVGAPDPEIAEVSPSAGPSAGGTTVTIQGANFQAGCEVWFGASPFTGLGGVQAASVELVGPDELRVVAPPRSAGTASVLVRDPSSGQAVALAGAFTYQGSGGGGGGGCSTVGVDGPLDPGQALRSLLGLLLLCLAVRALPRRPAAQRVRA